MAVDPGEESRNIHNVVVLPDEGISNLQQYQPTPNIPDLETLNMIKEIPNSNKDTAGNLKSDDPLARILPTEICLQIGGKFMQFLVNHGPELPKFTSRDKFLTERVHDMSSNRARKYKRSASFNSRRVLLLFSVLSSMGTIILIYLTLRVRQIGDRSGNV
ncbi:uncharacterized protein [Henckelia pumila]|uniref:uncharacterized protein isoform X3 n=1 Tax=Henckelia pumila TaxID=405737 RepID=UPI003C6DED94